MFSHRIFTKRADASHFAFLRGSLAILLKRSRATRRRELLELDDHILRDIGLTRSDVWHIKF